MKKIIIGLLLAVAAGLFLGYLFFGSNEKVASQEETVEATTEMWTCSMHPQIMLPHEGDCPICGMDLIPAGTAVSETSTGEIRLTEHAEALANIETKRLESGDIQDGYLVLSGVLEENKEKDAVISATFPARIESLSVNFSGEKVRKGQLLALLYSPELVAAQQELLTAISFKESQPQLYEAVRQKLRLWKLNDNQINALETSGKITERFPVYAWASGVVSELMVEEGDYVSQGQPLMKVSDLSTIWASFDIYENQIAALRSGARAEITTKAYPGEIFSAKADFIDPVLNTATRTGVLRATLNNSGEKLKPGMFVEARIPAASNENQSGVYVPSSSVLWTGETSLVYVRTEPGKPVFSARTVKLGKKSGEFYQVLEGLSLGDEVVVNGTFTVDAAAQLQGKSSMMTSEGKDSKSDVSEPFLEVTEVMKEKWGSLVAHYLQLKESLASDDADGAVKQAMKVKEALKNVSYFGDKTPARDAIEEWQSLGLRQLDIIISNSDLTTQRRAFKPLSDGIIELTERIGTGNSLYKQYCPMADNNTGGYWLSDKEQIENPYFGSAMHSCGEISQVLNR